MGFSILKDTNIQYPEAGDYFSPDQVFPEYKFSHISKQPNKVYLAVRKVFRQMSLDQDRFGKSTWNPLGSYIQPGHNVFVLCNFVAHKWMTEAKVDFFSKVIHASVLRAVIDYLLIAVGDKGKVYFGNAPLQSAEFEKILQQTGAKNVLEFYQGRGKPVEAVDLRLYKTRRNVLGAIDETQNMCDDTGVLIDLGLDSLLSELPRTEDYNFRVAEYNPDRLKLFHNNGHHIYIINPKIFDADVVFSIPKLKVHQKVGVTLSLKGSVGVVGHKDSLAHHRFGSPSIGGDEYPNYSYRALLHKISTFHDYVYRSIPGTKIGRILRILDKNLHRILRYFVPIRFGAWWGNDTCWRMALDLARIIAYANQSGMESRIQRKHIVLIDGIVGGEGNGPLRPQAVQSGVFVFADNPVVADQAASMLMGFDASKIPLVWKAKQLEKYPLLSESIDTIAGVYNGQPIMLRDLVYKSHYEYKAPIGWLGHIEH